MDYAKGEGKLGWRGGAAAVGRRLAVTFEPSGSDHTTSGA